MKVVFIGAGNLATNLAKEMYHKGFEILQIFSRTQESASALSAIVNSQAITEIGKIRDDAELYIFSVKDSVLTSLLEMMPHNKGIWVHTAGSMPMDVLKNYVSRYGVFYPLQTFSKAKEVDFKEIPLFIEADSESTLKSLKGIAEKLSDKVISADSEQRKYIHLAAVFACNFSNHMYSIADRLLAEHNISFDVLRPLIAETARKINTVKPVEAQTGPAVRYDENVINRHLSLLDDETLKEIYSLLSKSIHLSK